MNQRALIAAARPYSLASTMLGAPHLPWPRKKKNAGIAKSRTIAPISMTPIHALASQGQRRT
jgi:hypothetical protein